MVGHMRLLGGLICLAAIAVALPGLFLESWLGDVIFLVCIAALIGGVMLMCRPLTARELADGTMRKDLVGIATVLGVFATLFAIAFVVFRYVDV